MSRATRLPRATPVFVMGDSHSAAYADRLVWLGQGLDRIVVFRTLYCPGLRASASLDELGGIAQPLRAALRFGNLLVSNGERLEAFHRTTDAHWQALAGAEGRWPRQDPPLALSLGGLDVLDAIVAWPQPDVAPPAGARPEDAARWGTSDANAAAAGWFRERFEPLESALAQLQALGFERLALLSIVPPMQSDAAFSIVAARQGAVLPSRNRRLGLRYKLVLHANEALRAVARSAGVQFIDRWPEQTHDGLPARTLLNDNVHLTGEEADAAAAAVAAAFFTPAARQGTG